MSCCSTKEGSSVLGANTPVIALFSPVRIFFFLLLVLTGCHQPNSPVPNSPVPDKTSVIPFSEKLATALHSAGDNRSELEAVLAHYASRHDQVRLKAAQFLIANMPGQGSITVGWADKDGNDLLFNALDYPDYESARSALDRLEKRHGPLRRKKQGGAKDIETVDKDYLIKNIDLAVEVWQEKPWAKDLPFEYFCDYILPYRTSFEPLSDWRRPMMVRYLDAADAVAGPDRVKTVTSRIKKNVRRLVAFDSRYYLYPTSQGFDRMLHSRQGRCDDITTMMTYALRAQGFACAYDFTPAWADRDNNHAWLVVLDRQGKGRATLASRAAKVLRRTFSIQDRDLGDTGDRETVPAWMTGTHFIDVTSQYMPVTNVTVQLDARPEHPVSLAYLCVFNAGKWIPVHWGKIRDGNAVFTDMGRNIAYLPAFYIDRDIQPAAAPFILHGDGQIQKLTGGSSAPDGPVKIKAIGPAVPDADTRTVRPQIAVRPGRTYTLFKWDNRWESILETRAKNHSLVLEKAEKNRLYWFSEKGGRKLERIFTLENSGQAAY